MCAPWETVAGLILHKTARVGKSDKVNPFFISLESGHAGTDCRWVSNHPCLQLFMARCIIMPITSSLSTSSFPFTALCGLNPQLEHFRGVASMKRLLYFNFFMKDYGYSTVMAAELIVGEDVANHYYLCPCASRHVSTWLRINQMWEVSVKGGFID